MEYIYDNPTRDPRQSSHWQSLSHQEGDKCISNLDELKQVFAHDMQLTMLSTTATAPTTRSSSGTTTEVSYDVKAPADANARLALWSCLLGYCEGLCTSKQEQHRFHLFPIPIQALERLVETEFTQPLRDLVLVDPNNTAGPQLSVVCSPEQPELSSSTSPPQPQQRRPPPLPRRLPHRQAAQAISNWIWKRVKSKSNVKDEAHANSVWIVLRGSAVDGKSVDCFGAALATVIGLRQAGGYHDSILTLSEDHAYESHPSEENHIGSSCGLDATTAATTTTMIPMNTCEVAIPGNTKAQQAKRGQETSLTFAAAAGGKATTMHPSKPRLTPQTSWLYMGMAPVYCSTPSMIVAAALANLNFQIEQSLAQRYERNSRPLIELKRDLLWVLKDANQIDKFPFALCELAWSEEHVTSERGEAQVAIPTTTLTALTTTSAESSLEGTGEGDSHGNTNTGSSGVVLVTAIEALYHEAIVCDQTHYQNKQKYPYCYMGFYHKGAVMGQDRGVAEEKDEEYRLPLAVEYFSYAARIASTFAYEWGDSLQLSKVMIKLAEWIVLEILCSTSGERSREDDSAPPKAKKGQQHLQHQPRQWHNPKNAVSTAEWVLRFYDHLLAWEERSQEQFLPILKPSHPASIGKAFSLFNPAVRQEVLSNTQTQQQQQQQTLLQSHRLTNRKGSLAAALQMPKIVLSDLHFTLLIGGEQESEDTGRSSRRKRKIR
ncbi:hypothetical protein ACA910_013430 [Epithemia clementina (nom. ined.)]